MIVKFYVNCLYYNIVVYNVVCNIVIEIVFTCLFPQELRTAKSVIKTYFSVELPFKRENLSFIFIIAMVMLIINFKTGYRLVLYQEFTIILCIYRSVF